MAEEGEDRTEAPSEKRLREARAAGQVAISREASLLTGLAAGAVLLAATAPGGARQAAGRLALLLEQAGTLAPLPALLAAMRVAVGLVAPLALGLLVVGCATVLLQSGLMFNAGAWVPSLARLNPMVGLRRVLGPASLAGVAKSAIKVAAAGWGAWSALGGDMAALPGAVHWAPAQLGGMVLRLVLRIAVPLLLVQAAIAGFDVARTRMRHVSGLKMSREEAKQEHKESEGDPHVKGRIRKMRMARAKRRMLRAVPAATVVVTNPTHYAVALAYEPGKPGAPMVVAKGVDEMAFRIRAIAAEHRVPVVPNPPLARALFTVELDREIPAEHFKAVAELIAYVWKLRGRR